MTTTTWKALLTAGLVVATFGVAVAKLPPPPPMDEKAKAAAEEKKAKDAAAAELAKAQLAKAEDRVVARYIAEQKAKGITVHPTPIAIDRRARHDRARQYACGRRDRSVGRCQGAREARRRVRAGDGSRCGQGFETEVGRSSRHERTGRVALSFFGRCRARLRGQALQLALDRQQRQDVHAEIAQQRRARLGGVVDLVAVLLGVPYQTSASRRCRLRRST